MLLPLHFQRGYIKYCFKGTLRLIVLDNANFRQRSCSNLTSFMAYRTIMLIICNFLSKKKKKKNESESTGLASQAVILKL